MVQENTDAYACSLNLSNIAHAILALQHLKSQSGTHSHADQTSDYHEKGDALRVHLLHQIQPQRQQRL